MDDDMILGRGGDQDDIERYAEHNGADLTKKDIIEDAVHRAFELDLNNATTAEDAFAMLWIYYQALNEMVQPEAQDKDRMKKTRLMTPRVGHAITVYHAYVQSKMDDLQTQIAVLTIRLDQKWWNRVREWFRRGK